MIGRTTTHAIRKAISQFLLGAVARTLLQPFAVVAAISGLAIIAISSTAQDVALAPPAAAEQEGIETLVQGPIHEAFANPADLNPTPGPIVNRQPPPDVKEDPPEFMPDGAIWIAGYWIWDDERNDFVWVTGAARKSPPGMRFVSGYWAQVDGGWQRVAGFWISTNAADLDYRDAPPESLDSGPSSPAPADNYFWVSGSWNYYDTGYRWRAGYWSPYQPDWIWCPARWVWTPAGFVYIAGYWDFEMSLRGQIFSPLYFRTAYYTQPGWTYRPWCVIPTNNLFIHLWIRPNYCHYYFGNYYGTQYANWGLHSWCNLPTQYYFQDPFFNYCRVHYRRQGIDYIGRCQSWHNYYVQHADLRPPRTWQEQQHHGDRQGHATALQTQLVARNLADVARRDDAPLHLSRLDDASRRALQERTEKLHELNVDRKKVEHDAQVVSRVLPGGEAVRDLSGSGRDAARSARDMVRAKAQNDDAKKGSLEDRAKRGSLLEQAEVVNDAKGKKTHDRAGTTARLVLPKAVEASTTNSVGRKVLSVKDEIVGGHRDGVPPPMSDAEGAPKLTKSRVPRADRDAASVDRGTAVALPGNTGTVRSRTELPSSNSLPTITRDNVAKAAILKDKGSKVESRKFDPPQVIAPLHDIPKVERSVNNARRIDIPKLDGAKAESRRVETPKLDASRVDPGWIMPSLHRDRFQHTPSTELPSVLPRLAPRSDAGPKPRPETAREDRLTPRIDVQRDLHSAPRIEVPRESHVAPRIETPSAASPTISRFESSNTVTPRLAVPTDSGNSGHSNAASGKGNRHRDNDE